MNIDNGPLGDARVSLLIERALADPSTMRAMAMGAISMCVLLRDLKAQQPTPMTVVAVLEVLELMITRATTP